MVIATITEAKNQLSAFIDRVRSGESVLIVDRGIPVARLESAVGADAAANGKLARLERSGAVRAARMPPATELLSLQPPGPRRGAGAVEALIEDRRGGR